MNGSGNDVWLWFWLVIFSFTISVLLPAGLVTLTLYGIYSGTVWLIFIGMALCSSYAWWRVA